ncbi:MAG: cytochrome P450 [Streptosporangiales bacterium]|nr:cytochrome P450 [Streptosporangiales bacterium]
MAEHVGAAREPGPPEPLPWPSDPAFHRDPYPAYAQLRRSRSVGPVTLPSGLRAWAVTGFEEAWELLADPRLAKDIRRFAHLRDVALPPELNLHMLNLDPPDHTRLRRLVTKAFTARRVEALRPRIEQIAAELLDAMAQQRSADLIEAFAFPLPITVICELLGIPSGDRGDFRRWSNAVVSGRATRDELPEAVAGLIAYAKKLIAAKRAEPSDDLLSALTAARDEDDRLSEAELISMIFLLLIAGHETTVNLIGTGTFHLLTHPDQIALLRDDPSLLPSAIEELLRYDGPVEVATTRITAEPVEIAGVTIPAGEPVLVALAAVDRDPDRFPGPDRLDLTRGDAQHVAFGHGIHYCLGAPLARMEGQIAIGALLSRFPSLALAVRPGDLVWRPGLLLRGLAALPVTF